MPYVPGIVNVAEEADQRTPAISELMQIVLAQNYRTRQPQPPHDFRIFGRDTVLVKAAGGRCARARSIDQIFYRNRNPVEWPPPFSARDLNLRSPSLRQRSLGSHRDESIQRGIEFLNAIQASASHLDRGNFLPPQARGKLSNSFQSRHR